MDGNLISGNLSNLHSDALYLYSVGKKVDSKSALKRAALLLHTLVDQEINKSFRKKLLNEVNIILACFDDISNDKSLLGFTQQIDYLSSQINNRMFYPWRGPPLIYAGTVHSIPKFEDPDGLLPLSDPQLKIFKSWERPNVALGPNFSMESQGAEDLCQDYLDDCSIVASLLSIHFLERRTSQNIIMKNLYPQDENGNPVISPTGSYCVKLYINGCERMVTVDDRLPTTHTTKHSLFIQSQSNPGLLWPAIFEKAYLKVMGGYDFLGSYSASDTFAMTSWIPEYIYLDAYFQDSPTSSREALWNKIYKNFHEGNLMACIGTGSISKQEASALGLISDHDYAILDLREIGLNSSDSDKKRIALIKNPWIHEQETRVMSPLQLPPSEAPEAPNGGFWISFESVCLRFGALYLNWNPRLFPHTQKLNFLWSKASISMFTNTQVLVGNPQFKITNTSNFENITWILVDQHLMESGNIKGHIGISIYDANGFRVYTATDATLVHQGPYLNTSQYLLKIEIPPRKAYTLVMTASEKESKYSSINFTMMSYSIFPTQLEKVSEELPHKFCIDSQWTGELSGGSWSYQTYLNNPRYRLRVKEKSNIMKLLVYSQINYPMNIRVFSESDGLLRDLKKKHEITSSGEYRVGYTVARMVYLEPGDYTIVLSLFEPGISGPFTLICRSSSPFELTPLPSISAGYFERQLTVSWDNRSRMEIPLVVGMKGNAYFSAISFPDDTRTDTKVPETLSFYRPHIRLSVFNKTSEKLLQSNGFTDDRLGVFLDRIQLFSGAEYVCLIERMECGTGRVEIKVTSESPVIMQSSQIS